MAMVFAGKFGTPTRKVLALALADHADDDGASIYPSIARLAEKCEIDRRTVQRQLRAFEEEGLLAVVSVGGTRGKDTREWKFDLTKLAVLAEDRGGAVPPVARRQGRQPVQVGAALDTLRGGTVPPKPSVTIKEPSASDARAIANAIQKAEPTEPELAGLNGATHEIVNGMAKWLNCVMPDRETARRIIGKNVALYGGAAVKDAYADLETKMAAGDVIASPLKAFTSFCQTAARNPRNRVTGEPARPEVSAEQMRANLARVDDLMRPIEQALRMNRKPARPAINA